MKLRIADEARLREIDLPPGTVTEFGRQSDAELKQSQRPLTVLPNGSADSRRVIIGWNSEHAEYSRKHFTLEDLGDGCVRLTNVSANYDVTVSCKPWTIRSGESAELATPFKITSLPRRS